MLDFGNCGQFNPIIVRHNEFYGKNIMFIVKFINKLYNSPKQLLTNSKNNNQFF